MIKDKNFLVSNNIWINYCSLTLLDKLPLGTIKIIDTLTVFKSIFPEHIFSFSNSSKIKFNKKLLY